MTPTKEIREDLSRDSWVAFKELLEEEQRTNITALINGDCDKRRGRIQLLQELLTMWVAPKDPVEGFDPGIGNPEY